MSTSEFIDELALGNASTAVLNALLVTVFPALLR